MKTKLTLSLPAEVVCKAKRYVRQHGTSVSALLARTIQALPDEGQKTQKIVSREPRWAKFGRFFEGMKPFDERSSRILRKHGPTVF